MKSRLVVTAIVVFGLPTLNPRPALAHYDTLDGPRVRDARVAFDSKDVTSVLKWVGPDKEGEIRGTFQHALAVRALDSEARALADRFFFVRVHREGEGAPYTGLMPAGPQSIPPSPHPTRPSRLARSIPSRRCSPRS